MVMGTTIAQNKGGIYFSGISEVSYSKALKQLLLPSLQQ